MNRKGDRGQSTKECNSGLDFSKSVGLEAGKQ